MPNLHDLNYDIHLSGNLGKLPPIIAAKMRLHI